jgi:peptidoglycan/LPS O-acetylase OafA/YrhL
MKLHSLQALRAVAALLVVIDHALLEISDNQPGGLITHVAWTLGSAGVYVFFVISGFILVHISWGSFGRPSSATNFLRRRITRIVPLYWLATIAAFAYHKVSATHGASDSWPELVRSLAFIPYCGGDGSWDPVLPQGWSLNYEMMFYAIFALGLSFPRKIALPAVGITLGAFVVIQPLLPNETLAYLSSPIVLWFLLGMGLATLWHWGGFEESERLARSTRCLEPLGDASYSTYLVHGFILTIVLRAWLLAAGPPSIWVVPISVAITAIAGWATYRFVETPILRITANLWPPGRAIVAKARVPEASSLR